MHKLRVAASLVATLFLLVGCAGLPEVPYDRSSAHIETIGLVAPSFPDEPNVVLASNVGQSFGLIGALIEEGMRANRVSSFERVLKEKDFSARKTFVATLTDALAADGYEIKTIDRPAGKTDFLETYATNADLPVDAFLDVAVYTYGYIAAGIGSSTPYRPMIILKARLVKASDRAVIMQNQVAYNPIGFGSAAAKLVTIPPDPSYQFTDFDSLMADPPKAVTGLRTAVQQSAQTLSTLLK